MACRSASGSWRRIGDHSRHRDPPTVSKFGVSPVLSKVVEVTRRPATDAARMGRDVGNDAPALRIGAAGKAPVRDDGAGGVALRCGIRRNARDRPPDRRPGSRLADFDGIGPEDLPVEEGELPQAEAAADVERERQVVIGRAPFDRRQAS